MKKLSVILATYNEEKNIVDCLASVSWADEIVLVDGTSSDKTVELAKKYTSKIFIRKNPLMFHLNKQYAIEQATGEWILYLDADERVDEGLKTEILTILRQAQFNGYWLSRKNIIFGRWIKHALWSPDYNLRLFKRGKAYLPCKSVHEQPILDGEAGYLKNPLTHYNYQTVHQYLRKLNDLYTENDRNVFLATGKRISWYDAVRFPLRDFLANFFARQGYKDGLHGLVLSLLQAFSALVTFAKIWEAQKFVLPVPSEEKFLGAIRNEFRLAYQEISHWFRIVAIADARSFGQKLWKKFSWLF